MIPLDELPMRGGVGQFCEPTAEQLRFIKQCGCDDFQMNTPNLPGDERWEYDDVAAAVKKAEDAGLRLMSLENVPARFYDKIMLGKPGREDQLDNMAHTVRSLGRAGVPILGYNFMPTGVWRTANDTPVRGGALATSFNYERARKVQPGERTNFGVWATIEIDREYPEEEIWDNYAYYLQAILPVAEEAGCAWPYTRTPPRCLRSAVWRASCGAWMPSSGPCRLATAPTTGLTSASAHGRR